MRVAMLAALVGFALGLPGLAQEKPSQTKQDPPAEENLPTVDEVLDNYVKALGGREAMEKLTTRVAKGAFEIPTMGVISNAEIHAKAPNKWLLIIDIPSFGIIQQGFDGKSGWTQDPQLGRRVLGGGELEALKRSAEFNQPLKFRELYQTLKLKGKQEIDSRDAYVLEATPEGGSTENMYFDSETHLLIRADLVIEGPQGKNPYEVRFEDYRETDGIKLAHTVTRVNPAVTFVIKVEEIRHNVEIDDSKFQMPAAENPKP